MSVNSQTPIFPVLMVNFIGMLGYSLILPFLVFLVEKFGGNEFIYGILGSIYPAFQLVGGPMLGRLSDRIGRRSVLLISQVGTFLAWLLFILALFLPRFTLLNVETPITGAFLLTLPLITLFVARALDGLTGGNVSVANAYLSDISTDENRKANFGKMASSTSLGFIVGPVIAGLLGATVYEELLPVAAAALISLLAIGMISRYLPESRPDLVNPNLNIFSLTKMFQIEHKECFEMEDCPTPTTLRDVLGYPYVPLLFTIYFLTFLGFSFFYSAFPVFASGGLQWNSTQLGLFFTISSGVMVLFQGPVLSFLSKRTSDASLVLVGSIFIGLNFLLLYIGTDVSVWIGVLFLSMGNGIMWPSFLSLLSRSGSPEIQGTLQGYANSTGSLASIFGLILGGIVYQQVGPSIFLVSAVVLFFIFLISFRLIPAEQDLKTIPGKSKTPTT